MNTGLQHCVDKGVTAHCHTRGPRTGFSFLISSPFFFNLFYFDGGADGLDLKACMMQKIPTEAEAW